jgi:hypothetical protein
MKNEEIGFQLLYGKAFWHLVTYSLEDKMVCKSNNHLYFVLYIYLTG